MISKRIVNTSGDVWSPVVTPFNNDLTPNKYLFFHHCLFLLEHDVGLAIFGTNSEANSLTIQEKIALLDYLVEEGIPPERIMPGTGSCTIAEAATLTLHAVEAG